MPQKPQPPRDIDAALAELAGASVDDMVAMKQALRFHDGSYNSFYALLRRYGASEAFLDRVQDAIEDEMGQMRQSIHVNDKDTHAVWGFGYSDTEEEVRRADRIEPEDELKTEARYRFNWARRMFGDRGE